MSQPVNVLFLCTGNSARGIIAEAILNREGAGKFKAFSAGAKPKGAVNPHVIQLLSAMHFPTDALRSKSWDEFAGPDALKMDFVFTVCGAAAEEECPVWAGHPITAVWAIPDPIAVQGSEAVKSEMFVETFHMLNSRIMAFINLPMSSLSRLSLQEHVDTLSHH